MRLPFIASITRLLTSCISQPKYTNRAEKILADINDPNSEYVVVISHRGDWRNYPENSIPAIESIISMGVDLMELDLLTGKAVFLKSGASPTYVRRDDCLFKLHAQTAPIGILRTVDAQKITYDVLPGDVVIMVSDGISEDNSSESTAEDCLWLLDLLADGWQNDLNLMAEAILTRARKEGSQDDLSVILIEVCEA